MKTNTHIICFLFFISSSAFSLGIRDFRNDCALVKASYNGENYRLERFDFVNYMGTSQAAEIRLKMDDISCVYNQLAASFVIKKIAGASIASVVNVSITQRPDGLIEVGVTNYTSDCIPSVYKSLTEGLIAKGVPWNDTLAHEINENVTKEYCPKFEKLIRDSIIQTLSSMN